jgi:hypothetical protein
MKKEDNILDKIGNEKPFSVPENYFEKFSLNIDTKITEPKVIHVNFYQKVKPFIYVAAMLAVVFFAGGLYLKTTSTTNKSIAALKENTTTVNKNQTDDTILLSSADENSLDENTLMDYIASEDQNQDQK